jgi:hypothetical protein
VKFEGLFSNIQPLEGRSGQQLQPPDSTGDSPAIPPFDEEPPPVVSILQYLTLK